MTVDEARERLQQIKGQLVEGKNLLKEKEKVAAEKTFGEAFEMYIDRHVRIESKPHTVKDIEQRMKKSLSHWAKRGLSSITRQEAQEMHNR
jgi:hypothetical protein